MVRVEYANLIGLRRGGGGVAAWFGLAARADTPACGLKLQHRSRGVGHEGAAGESPLNASVAWSTPQRLHFISIDTHARTHAVNWSADITGCPAFL